MTITEAVKKAIEGGYDPHKYFTKGKWGNPIKCVVRSNKNWTVLYSSGHRMDSGTDLEHDFLHFLLDPEFWKCLGKAMGWKDKIVCCDYSVNCQETMVRKEWLYEWHTFIDHLASGGQIETYFKELK